MLELFLSWGNLYLPAGIVFLLFGVDKTGVIYLPALVCGILFTIVGLFTMQMAHREALKRDMKEAKKFGLLLSEIRGLRLDLRGGKNDFNNTDDRK